MPPKSTEQHRNGAKGVRQFIESLPSDKKSEHRFSEVDLKDDYGIDGWTQVFKDQLHTGEIYLVQVKTDKEASITKRGVITFSLETDKAEFYIELLKEPLVFVLSDLKTKKTYWHDIQTNGRTLELYRQAKKEKANYVTIEVDPNLTLPETTKEYYDYIKLASEKINKREEMKRLSLANLSKAVEEVSQYEGETLGLKGYDILQGAECQVPLFLDSYSHFL